MMKIHTWILVLCTFIATVVQYSINADLKDGFSDRETVVNAVVRYIKRNNGSNPRRSALNNDSGRKNRDEEGGGIGSRTTDKTISAKLADSKISGRKRAVLVDKVHVKFDDYGTSGDSSDDSSDNTNSYSSDCSDVNGNGGDGGGGGVSKENGGGENTKSDDSITDDCGILGCGVPSPWQQAPERVWQGVISGLSDWTIKPIRNKYGRGRPVAKSYSDRIFGSNFL